MQIHVFDSSFGLVKFRFGTFSRSKNFGFFAWLIFFWWSEWWGAWAPRRRSIKKNQPSNGGGSPGAHSPENLQSGWLREVRFIRSASLDSDQLDFKIPSEFIQKYAKQGSWLAWGPTVHVSLAVLQCTLRRALKLQKSIDFLLNFTAF